jgi:hypothetical protein
MSYTSLPRRVLIFLIPMVLLVLCSQEHASYASLITYGNLPPGVNPGDPFRVIFVTSGTRDATSSNLAEYDTFVQGYAPAGLSTTWRAIGSAAGINARDHTSTMPGTDGAGIPIFNIHGELLADNYADLWDGTLQNAVTYNQAGVSLGFATVWTGTLSDGRAVRSPLALGDSQPLVGANWRTSSLWIDTGLDTNTVQHHVYGISDVITAVPVPEPSSLALGVMAGLALLGYELLSRRKRMEKRRDHPAPARDSSTLK